MDLELNDKTALVTGSSRGMGKAAALALAREGAAVAICARGAEDLAAAAAEIRERYGVRVAAVPCDLSDADAIEPLIAAATAELGRINICVANSGGPQAGTVLEMDDAAWRHAVDNNFLNMIRLCLATVRPMMSRGWGRIITITSDTVREVADGIALSSIVRPGVASFVKVLARQVAAHGVTVNNLMPGGFRTSRAEELAQREAEQTGLTVDDVLARGAADTPMQRIGDPMEIGDVIAFLASERASYVSGASIPVDGADSRFAA